MAIYVIGSLNMDIVASADHHPAKGETIIGNSLNYYPGGKGLNQAIACSYICEETYLVGNTGNDDFGKSLKSYLQNTPLKLNHITEMDNTSTGVALITVANNDNTIVVIPGANNTLSYKELNLNQNDFVIAQFEIPQSTILEYFKAAKKVGATTILNPAPAASCDEILHYTDILVMNETEESVLSQATKKVGISITTLGAQGLKATTPSHSFNLSSHAVNAVDSTGAGDCFVGYLVGSLSQQKSLEESLAIATAAAALSVTKPGASTSIPRLKEVQIFQSKEAA